MRELSNAAKGKRSEAWDRQSVLCFYLLQPHVKEGQSIQPRQFDAFNYPDEGELVTKIEFSELHEFGIL